MIKAWRNELLGVAALILAAWLSGLLLGETQLVLAATIALYFAWHLANLIRLQVWIARRRGLRLPHSVGVWEAVFDGLQRESLRNRRRKRALLGSLAAFRQAAESLPDGLTVLDANNRLLWYNPAAERLLGLGRSGGDRGGEIAQVIRHPVLEDDLARGAPSRPLEVPSPANGAWMLSVQVTERFIGTQQRLLVARDITPVYRLEQARRDFVASVSHELRTPITVFRGYLEALQDTVSIAPEWEHPVALMDQQARRMQDLVGDLLALSRLEMSDRPRSIDPVPVAETLAMIVDEARVLSGDRKHVLQLEADPRVWLLGDASKLRSAFSNLIFNAVRHTPSGSRISIAWNGDADGASLTVRDSGSGISAHHLPRLTERFYRVDSDRSRRTGGTDLGLAIVKQVLDRHGAGLRIHSKVGEGTRFTCQFPARLVNLVEPPELSRAG